MFDHFSSFVRRDALVLSDNFRVHGVQYRGKRDLPKLAWRIFTTSLNVSWFALGYAYSAGVLSRASGKPNVIIVGGWDVAYEPEIGYGAMGTPRRVRLTTRALASAAMVLAVSEATRREVLRWVNREVHVVPHGVDAERFVPDGGPREGVATVASVANLVQFRVKGIDVLLEVARALPEVPFRLIGRIGPEMRNVLEAKRPLNLHFVDWLEEARLIEALRRTRVYFQPSYRESFGVALLEAMACGCLPVVSDRKALPEVVGDAGLVCPYGDIAATAEALRAAMASDGRRARARVLERFTIQKRKERLVELLGRLVA